MPEWCSKSWSVLRDWCSHTWDPSSPQIWIDTSLPTEQTDPQPTLSGLYFAQLYLTWINTYLRMTFADFSSEFNSIFPHKLVNRLSNAPLLLGIEYSLKSNSECQYWTVHLIQSDPEHRFPIGLCAELGAFYFSHPWPIKYPRKICWSYKASQTDLRWWGSLQEGGCTPGWRPQRKETGPNHQQDNGSDQKIKKVISLPPSMMTKQNVWRALSCRNLHSKGSDMVNITHSLGGKNSTTAVTASYFNIYFLRKLGEAHIQNKATLYII